MLVLSQPHSTEVLPDDQREPLVFQYVPTASCPVIINEEFKTDWTRLIHWYAAVVGLQLYFVYLCSPYSGTGHSASFVYPTVFIPSPYFNSSSMIILWETVKSLTEVRGDYMCYSALIYQVNYFIVEGYQVDQT